MLRLHGCSSCLHTHACCREEAWHMFDFGYTNYMKHAFPKVIEARSYPDAMPASFVLYINCVPMHWLAV
jgi:hypothetical protein